MENEFDYWQFLAGLGVFLFGMHYMEIALKNLAGRSFKKFLRKHTNSPIKGILGGAGITAILQSSSVVSLMVMAFVGARIINMRSALGVIFGSNLGTTVTGWIVAYIGFKFELNEIILPLVAIGALLIVMFSKTDEIYDTGRFLFGFGFLFLGLSWMKVSIEFYAANIDLSQYDYLNDYLFVFLGLILTAIIQSSSAMIVITLSALGVGAITLEVASIIVIGSNIGTTITIILGAIKGTESKKQLALGHVLFNVITACVALVLLHPILWFITNSLTLTDPLIALVAFHTIFNLLGIILFFPIIGKFADFLEKRFLQKEADTEFINKVSPEIPVAAIEAMRNEGKRFCSMVLNLNRQAITEKNISFSVRGMVKLFQTNNYDDQYQELKKLEGELIDYSVHVQDHDMNEAEKLEIQSLLHGLSKGMQSAKNVKDIIHNIKDFESTSDESKRILYTNLRNEITLLQDKMLHFMETELTSDRFEELVSLSQENYHLHQSLIKQTYEEVKADKLSNAEIATFLNLNREFYISSKALIHAMSDFWLSMTQSSDFGKLPNIHN
ncbi:MAG: Na/Pi symporter [Crocinitomicaceae bacterium]